MTFRSILATGVKALALGREPQAFLDAGWVRQLLTAAPARWREHVALYVLTLSPHYCFDVPQYRGVSRLEFGRREFARNMAARRVIGDRLLRHLLTPNDTVLDYGCGPGFLVTYLREHAHPVYGVDISRGALECARILNAAPNVTYLRPRRHRFQPPAWILRVRSQCCST